MNFFILVRHPKLININCTYTFGNHLTFKLDFGWSIFKILYHAITPLQTLGWSMWRLAQFNLMLIHFIFKILTFICNAASGPLSHLLKPFWPINLVTIRWVGMHWASLEMLRSMEQESLNIEQFCQRNWTVGTHAK
jgi:hypothetical protein